MKRYLYIPKQYDLVVGETFELFYRGIVNSVSIDTYDFEISYSDRRNRGKGFARKYIFTPTEADVGLHEMTVRLWSNEGEVLDEATCKVNIVPPPKDPEEERVILLMGASDAGPGVWPAELGRRFLATDGEPCGLGFKNVCFIGSREKDGIRYEGYGGWTFTSYMTENRLDNFMNIYGDFSDKVAAVDQHSHYRDENGEVWKLETVTPTRIKLICYRAAAKLPSLEGGRLVHESGGKNLGDIVYTSAERADANPYWNDEKGADDFRSYAKKFGKDKIDEIVVTLTWNSHSWTKEVYKETVKKFVDTVHADFPDCHITFVGGYFPGRDGCGQNYGISWPWFPKLMKLREFDDAREELVAEDPTHLSFVHLSSRYDSDNNGMYAEFPVNARNQETETLCSNALHVAPCGSHQISDAVFCHLATRMQD